MRPVIVSNGVSNFHVRSVGPQSTSWRNGVEKKRKKRRNGQSGGKGKSRIGERKGMGKEKERRKKER